MIGIKNPQNASANAFPRSPQLAFLVVGWIPFFRTSIIITTISARPIKIPGIIPPANISAMDTPVIEA